MLKSGIEVLKGIGPSRAAQLHRLGIQTVEDLLFCLPRGSVNICAKTKKRTCTAIQDGTGLWKISDIILWVSVFLLRL